MRMSGEVEEIEWTIGGTKEKLKMATLRPENLQDTLKARLKFCDLFNCDWRYDG